MPGMTATVILADGYVYPIVLEGVKSADIVHQTGALSIQQQDGHCHVYAAGVWASVHTTPPEQP